MALTVLLPENPYSRELLALLTPLLPPPLLLLSITRYPIQMAILVSIRQLMHLVVLIMSLVWVTIWKSPALRRRHW